MSIAKLRPYFKQTVWGGNSLRYIFGKPCGCGIGESWELSAIPGCESLLEFSDGRVLKVSDYIRQSPNSVMKESSPKSEFPLLIKFIDSVEFLSIQVHPKQEYVSTHCEVKEKNELWCIVNAEQDSVIGCGFVKDVNDDEINSAIKENRLETLLNFVPVQTGDMIYIPEGTVHCIGKGILLAEIQQSSDSTFRLYDFGRGRKINIDEALQCCNKNRTDIENIKLHKKNFACEFFKCFNIAVNGGCMLPNTESFKVVIVLGGEGKVNSMQVFAGDCVFIPADEVNVSVFGELNILTVYLK